MAYDTTLVSMATDGCVRSRTQAVSRRKRGSYKENLSIFIIITAEVVDVGSYKSRSEKIAHDKSITHKKNRHSTTIVAYVENSSVK